MYYLIIMFLFTSLMFSFLLTPLSMTLILIMQTVLISMLTAILISSYWYSYMLILIMISGLLIMFIYMASITSNEKFKSSFKFILILPFLHLIFKKKDIMFMVKKNYNESLLFNQEIIMTKLFNSKFISPSIMMITFLFSLMITISFLISTTEGPMRKSN